MDKEKKKKKKNDAREPDRENILKYIYCELKSRPSNKKGSMQWTK